MFVGLNALVWWFFLRDTKRKLPPFSHGIVRRSGPCPFERKPLRPSKPGPTPRKVERFHVKRGGSSLRRCHPPRRKPRPAKRRRGEARGARQLAALETDWTMGLTCDPRPEGSSVPFHPEGGGEVGKGGRGGRGEGGKGGKGGRGEGGGGEGSWHAFTAEMKKARKKSGLRKEKKQHI